MHSQFFNDELRDLYQEGNLGQVVIRCQEILNDLPTSEGNENQDVAQLWEDMGQAYFDMREHQAALDATTKAMTIYRTVDGDRSPGYIRSLCNLGAIHRRIGGYAEAVALFDQAMELVETLPPAGRWQRASVLIGMAWLHVAREEYKKAEQLLLKAAKQRLVDYNWLHPEFGAVYHHLSRLYWTMGKRFAAERAIRKALRIYREASHMETAKYAMMLAFQGDIRSEQRDPLGARVCYRLAIDILSRMRGTSAQIANIKAELAKLSN